MVQLPLMPGDDAPDRSALTHTDDGTPMPRDAAPDRSPLTHTDDGTPSIPANYSEWRDWVSASTTRNHALGEPLLDWLNEYGRSKGFQRDDADGPFDQRTDFLTFIFAKGNGFEAAMIGHIRSLISVYEVHPAPRVFGRDLAAAEDTLRAMRRGEPAIYQAVLRDPESRTYGIADLLLRSDELLRLFPDAISAADASVSASAFGDVGWHYRVIDFKFSTLHFKTQGALSETDGSKWAYMQQVYIYNRALGRLQGYEAPESFLLGRGWQQGDGRGDNAMERLGAVPQNYVSSTRGRLADSVEAACSWLRRLRTEGAAWDVIPAPSVPELRPVMGHTEDQPWHRAKQRIAAVTGDATVLWHVGAKGRDLALTQGITRWQDPACTPEALGVTGPKVAPTLAAILSINQTEDGPPMRPARVHAAEGEWRPVPPLEFFVDFETVSDLDDDFSRLPRKGGQALIFMIGCGHVEDGAWQWRAFTADALDEPSEGRIIDEWFAHMDLVKKRLDSGNPSPPRIHHWSDAEQSTLESAFNSARNRHPDSDWPHPNWFDLLGRVVRAEPIVIRGAFGFGLKTVATEMKRHGFIETSWGVGPTDGLGAMVGAWWCAGLAASEGLRLTDVALMSEIAQYNEVDCRVIWEILNHLRENH